VRPIRIANGYRRCRPTPRELATGGFVGGTPPSVLLELVGSPRRGEIEIGEAAVLRVADRRHPARGRGDRSDRRRCLPRPWHLFPLDDCTVRLLHLVRWPRVASRRTVEEALAVLGVATRHAGLCMSSRAERRDMYGSLLGHLQGIASLAGPAGLLRARFALEAGWELRRCDVVTAADPVVLARIGRHGFAGRFHEAWYLRG